MFAGLEQVNGCMVSSLLVADNYRLNKSIESVTVAQLSATWSNCGCCEK